VEMVTKSFKLLRLYFHKLRFYFHKKKIKKIQNCDINVQIVAEMCPNHKMATMFEVQKCGRGVQKPA
jgi:nucleoside 2-deoxyribosyltransferase